MYWMRKIHAKVAKAIKRKMVERKQEAIRSLLSAAQLSSERATYDVLKDRDLGQTLPQQ